MTCRHRTRARGSVRRADGSCCWPSESTAVRRNQLAELDGQRMKSSTTQPFWWGHRARKSDLFKRHGLTGGLWIGEWIPERTVMVSPPACQWQRTGDAVGKSRRWAWAFPGCAGRARRVGEGCTVAAHCTVARAQGNLRLKSQALARRSGHFLFGMSAGWRSLRSYPIARANRFRI